MLKGPGKHNPLTDWLNKSEVEYEALIAAGYNAV
jgi:hypothetical protein